ncbi:unnamed protein product [Caenorhabditis nigoni]
MDSFSVFEEVKISKNAVKNAEFSCQTEEISFENTEVQTIEESIKDYKEEVNDEELAYWQTIVANRQEEVDRLKKINEELSTECAEKRAKLKEKEAEYKRLFDLGNEKLNESKTSEEDTTAEELDKSAGKA